MSEVKIFRYRGYIVHIGMVRGRTVYSFEDVRKVLRFRREDLGETIPVREGVYHLVLPRGNGRGRQYRRTFITKRDVYRCVRRSRSPYALDFWDWIKNEVSPIMAGPQVKSRAPRTMVDKPLGTREFLETKLTNPYMISAILPLFNERLKEAYIEAYDDEPALRQANIEGDSCDLEGIYTREDKPLMEKVFASMMGDL